MIKNINVNLELMELLNYYWKATSEKEKVGEKYIYSVIEHEHMKPLYSDHFSPEVARQVLSAISNREIFKPVTKEAGRFWNNHMWMMEDLAVTDAMFAPIKQLNLDHFINNETFSKAPESLTLVFVPGHLETVYKEANTYYVNFFKLMTAADMSSVSIEGQQLQDYIESLLV